MSARRPTRFISAAALLAASLSASLAGLTATPAFADPKQTLSQPARPLPRALTDLAITTGISIGGADPSQCGATPHALTGAMTAQAALKQLLAGSQCDVKRIDAKTFLLVRQASKPIRQKLPLLAPAPIAVSSNDDIPLTVVRRPTRLFDTPAGASVVAPPLLSGNDTDLASLAPHVSGMTVTNLGPGRDKIFLRGIADSVLTGRTQSTVGLYLDNAPITYNAPDPDLLLVDMARLEVLKGPQGNLYGQGTLSGVVRLVTNKPDPSGLSADITTAFGSASTGKPSWRETGFINVPLNDKAAARLVLYSEKTAGFIKDVDLTRTASNDTQRQGGRLALLWHVMPAFTLQTQLAVQDLRSANSQYVAGKKGVYRRTLNVAEPHDNIFRNLSVTATHDTGAGTLQITYNDLRHKIRSGYDAQPIGRYVSVTNSGVLYFEENQVIHLSNFEASFVSPSERKLRWLAGLFAARSNETFTPNLIDVYTHRTLYNEKRKDNSDDVAAFGKVTWDFAPKWSFSAGLRLQRSRHSTYSHINQVHLVGYATSGHIKGHIHAKPISHELMLSYMLTPSLKVYALSTDGFRTGGFNTTTLTHSTVPAKYVGDHLESLETGLKYRSSNGRIRIDSALFRLDWQNIQSDQLRPTGLPMTLNLGDGHSDGFEIEAGWRPITPLSLQLNGQLYDPKLSQPNPAYPGLLASGMPYIARSSLSLTARWQQSLFGHPLSYGGVLMYRGRSPLNYGIGQVALMKGYTNVDLSSDLDLAAYRLGLRVTNVTSNRSNSFAYGNPFALGTIPQNTPLRPRTFWLSVSRSF